MGTGQSERQAPIQEQLTQWCKRHPYLLGPGRIIMWLIAKTRETLAVVFATWPSMHDPISHLLNAADAEEADRLTEMWTDAKLKELNYVGISVRITWSSFFVGDLFSRGSVKRILTAWCFIRARLSLVPSPPPSPGTRFKTIHGLPRRAG